MNLDKPSDFRVSEITHSIRPEIGRKFSFFADALTIVNQEAGEFKDFEVGTHISVVKYLIFSLDALILSYEAKRAKSIVLQGQYICRSHPLFQSSDLVIKEYYPGVRIHFDNLESHSGHTVADVKYCKDQLILIAEKLKLQYFENITNELAKYIICAHKVKFHKRDIQYLAKLCFSHFYLQGYTRKAISSFRNDLLSTGLESDDEKIYSNGILPTELHTRLIEHNSSNAKFDHDLYKEIKEFFEKRGPKGQVLGLLSVSEYSRHKYSFLFKVEGIWFKENEQTINGYGFVATKDFKEKNKKSLSDEETKQFLTIPSALVLCETTGFSQYGAAKDAFSELNHMLSRLGLMLNKKFSLNPFGYLVYHKEEGRYRYFDVNPRIQFNQWDLEALNYRNTVLKNSVFDTFLKDMEAILSEAYNESDASKSVHGYSQFVEALMNGQSVAGNGPLTGIPARVLGFGYLSLLTEMNDYKRAIQSWAFNVITNVIGNSSPAVIGLTKEKLQEFRQRKRLPSLTEINREINHPHTSTIVARAKAYKSSVEDFQAFHYYIRLLSMLVRLRNIHEHQTTSDGELAKKIVIAVHPFFKRIVQLITSEFAKPSNSNLTAQEVINKLILDGKNKANALGISA